MRSDLQSELIGASPQMTELRLEIERIAPSDAKVLITGESGFNELPAVMARLARAPGDTLCHRIRY